ncbi:UPF0303 protein [Spirochaetia bacterium]|nr:UPF0303 protein [Spirochaetia bacterium]
MMEIDEGIGIVEKQEELLRFTHFSRADVWKLGKELVSKIQDEGFALSVSIRLNSGFVLFQYAPEGTTANNENWMTRKFNTVRDMEISSLLNSLRLKQQNKTLENKGLDPRLYAAGGGGFPIRLKGTGVIGAVIASGLPHLQDHDVLVECISRHLKARDVPRIPLDAGF